MRKVCTLTLLWRRSLSYRKILQSKSMHRFLYDRDLGHERVKHFSFLFRNHSKIRHSERGGGGSWKKWQKATQGEKVQPNKPDHTLKIFFCLFFLQISVFSSTSHKVLIILQSATKKIHLRHYLCVWDSYISRCKVF